MHIIDHESPVLYCLEMVFVVQTPEVTCHHFIRERLRDLHFGDLRLQDPRLAQVTSFPGDRFVQPDQSGRTTGNCFLLSMGHCFFMKIDAPGQVKKLYPRELQ